MNVVDPLLEERFPPDGAELIDQFEPAAWGGPPDARTAQPLPTSGRRVRLEVPTDDHLMALWQLSTDPVMGFRWRHNGMGIGPQEFAAQLWQGVTCQFVIVHQRSSELVGWVIGYGLDQRNQHLSIAVHGFPTYLATPALWEGIFLFCQYVFGNLPLQKLYAEVPEFNLATFVSGVGKVFEIEGCLRNHLWHDAMWWDQYVLGITREHFAATTETYGRWLRGVETAETN